MSDKKTQKLKVFKFGEVNLPIFEENKSKGWINYGKDNLYPEYLVKLKRTSPKHSAMQKRKADMTAGKGWIETALNKEFIANTFGESLDRVAYKAAYDLAIYGGFALHVTWSIDKTQIAKVEYCDFRK